MKTTASKGNSTPSHSSKPFFTKKGEGGFFGQTQEVEQPFFAPAISRQGVDEFFASAYGAYVQNKKLLQDIINFYSKFDKTLKPIATRLLSLLAQVGNAKSIAALPKPSNNQAGEKSLSSLINVPDHTTTSISSGHMLVLLDPTQLRGPSAIKC